MFDWLDNIVDKIKNLNSSVEEYKKDTVIQSLPSLAYVNKAKKFIESDKFEEAEKILLVALELPQKDPLVYKYLGLVYDKQKRLQEAVEAYQNSADLNPHDKNIWQKLGFALMAIDKYEEAEKSFENSNKITPNNTDTFTGWGMALMKMKKLEDAREKFTIASKLNKYNFSAIFLNAVIDVKLGDYNKAEMKLTFLANVCPNETNTYEFAHLKFIKGEKESAIHYALKSLEHNPNMLPSYLLLGKVYALNFDVNNSLKYFQMAESKELFASSLYYEWGLALEKFERYGDAKVKFLKSLELDNSNNEALSHLGLCNVALKNFDEASPVLEKVLSKEPDNRVVKQALGIIDYENDNLEHAIVRLKESLNDEIEDAINYYYLAKCYEKLDNDTKVKDNYETAISLNPKYLSALIDYSKYLISKNNYAEAQRKLRKALKADNENVGILNLLFNVSYTLVKADLCEYNIKETVAIAQKIEDINPNSFEYPNEKAELLKILEGKTERD